METSGFLAMLNQGMKYTVRLYLPEVLAVEISEHLLFLLVGWESGDVVLSNCRDIIQLSLHCAN